MILKMSFVLFLVITSASVRAGAEKIPDEFKNVCKNFLAFINKAAVNSEKKTPQQLNYELTKFMGKMFTQEALHEKSTKIGEFTNKILKESSDSSTDLCKSELLDKFKPKDLIKSLVAEDNVVVSSGGLGITTVNPKAKTVKVLNQRMTEGHCAQDQATDCDVKQEPLSAGTSQLENHVTKPLNEPFSEADCFCFEKKLFNEIKNKNNIISKEAKQGGRISKLIAEAAGKKFLNDYASFHEDISYFETNKGRALQKNANLKLDKNFLCTESNTFKAAIDAACTANQMMDGKDARIAALLGVYGDNFTPGKNMLKEGFDNLLSDIDAPADKLYTRHKFDKARFGMTNLEKGLPEVIVLDQLTAKIVQNKDLKKRLQTYMDGGATPLAAIEKIFTQPDTKTLFELLKDIKHPHCQDFISKLSSLKGEALDAARKDLIDVALVVHPGLKSMLTDRKLFDKAAALIPPRKILEIAGLASEETHGIIQRAEDNLLLKDHFIERCQTLQRNLAEAVCTDPATLKDKVSKNDLIQLLGADTKIDAENVDAIDLAICHTNNNKVLPGSAFAGLVIDDGRPFTESDYRFKKEPNGATSFFANSAKKSAEDPVYAARLNKIASAFDYDRVSTGNSSSTDTVAKPYFNENEFVASLRQKYGADKVSSESITTPQSNSTSIPESSNENTTSNLSQINSQFKSNATNNDVVKGFSQPFQASTAQPIEEPRVQDILSPRTELKNMLSNGGDQAKISKHLDNINDEDARELVRLRNVVSHNKDEITALKLEQEAKRTEELKTQYEALEKKFDLLTKEKAENANRFRNSGSFDGGQDFKGQSFGTFNEKTNSFDNKVTGETKGHFESGISGSSNQSAVFRDPAMSGTSGAVNSYDNIERGDQKLVITSNIKDGKKALVDPSTELITYLTKNEPDSKTLKELKESGMIYTYDLDENGKIVQVSKLIKYNELSVEAKTLVDNKLLLLSQKEPTQFSELEKQILLSKRNYSYQALKLELLAVGKKF